MENKDKEKIFNEFWERHQKQLILNAPKELRDEYVKSTQLDTPLDWVCFVLPIAAGIGLFPLFQVGSEVLSWLIMAVVVIVLFVLMQMLKPLVSRKKTTPQVVGRIKAHYYNIYVKTGDIESLDMLRM